MKLAIEIDRGTKRQSLDKLIAEAEAGALAIWVRWSGWSSIPVPPSIGLVELRAVRTVMPGTRGFRYRRTPYLTWPAPPQHSGQPVKMTYQPRLFDLERQPVQDSQRPAANPQPREARPDVA
jgi:hypothetical protein